MVRRGDRPPRFFQDFDVMPWVKGIAAISITFLAFYLYQGLSYSIERLDVTDADKLKEVYFGNDTCPEEETRRRVESERAKREAMEKAREDLVAAAGEEGKEEGGEGEEEDEDVIDLDEL
ncbi:Hypothetical protein NocV09_04700240 [Nannochloropsis oceanica]